MKDLAVNIAVFQVAWLGCVSAAAAGLPWAGTVLVALVLAWHLRRAPRHRAESALIASAVVIGIAWETLVVQADWLRYSSGTLVIGMPPHWIIALWALFATTLNVSMRWFKGRWAAAALAGAVAGPLAYYAGERLGAVQFPDLHIALIALALGWAAITPALVRLSQVFDGFPASSRRVQGA